MNLHAAWRAIVFIIICVGLWPAHVLAQESYCSWGWIAPGQRTVTPAVVTGSPRQRVALLGHHPQNDTPYAKSLPDGGYLLTGDKVDFVTACSGYVYVRFHGPKRVSTGWVEASSIRATGVPYIPLPPNAVALCRAAEAKLNLGERLRPMHSTSLDPKLLNSLHLEEGSNASPAQVAHFVVDGRPLAATSIDSGGTCHSTEVFVLTGDLKSRLSPPDRDSRDVENGGDDTWSFGVREDLVTVLGQPMVMSPGIGSSTFHLSVIDKNGDIVPTCEGHKVNLDQRKLISSTNARVCNAILARKEKPIAMQSPGPNESLLLEHRPDTFTKGYPHDTSTKLYFRDNEHAAEASYSLKVTGSVDLDNSGKPRRVGLVSLKEGNSTAGCGDFNEHQVTPVYLDEHGHADPSSIINKKLADALPDGMDKGKLVTYQGSTYLELSRSKGPPSELWEIDAQGPRQICSFKLTHIVVRPISH